MKKQLNHRYLASILFTLCFFSSLAVADKPRETLFESRYASAVLGAEVSQLNLLEGVVELSIPTEFESVGTSLEYLLTSQGYVIGDLQDSPEQYLLFALPLPASHRQLGPMTLREAIQMLGGDSFEPVINPVKRSLTYRLKEEFHQFVSADDIDKAKLHWEARNHSDAEIPETCDLDVSKGSYGPVRAGESLSAIVDQYRFDGLTRNQALVLLFQTNPHAFEGNNMNHLLQGVTLVIPGDWAGFAIAPLEASQIVLEHFRRWTDLVPQDGEPS